jgi:hypothetical protein
MYMTLVVGWLEHLAGEARGRDRRGWAWWWRDTWRCRWV